MVSRRQQGRRRDGVICGLQASKGVMFLAVAMILCVPAWLMLTPQQPRKGRTTMVTRPVTGVSGGDRTGLTATQQQDGEVPWPTGKVEWRPNQPPVAHGGQRGAVGPGMSGREAPNPLAARPPQPGHGGADMDPLAHHAGTKHNGGAGVGMRGDSGVRNRGRGGEQGRSDGQGWDDVEQQDSQPDSFAVPKGAGAVRDNRDDGDDADFGRGDAGDDNNVGMGVNGGKGEGDTSAPLFPPGVTLEDPGPASRHIDGMVQQAEKKLQDMYGTTARILGEYPPHIQELVGSMPQRRFKYIQYAREHYKGVKPITAPTTAGRSGFVLSNRRGANSAVATNVCFDKGQKVLLVYRGSSAKSVISKSDKHLLTKVGHAGFKWTWKIKEVGGSPPKRAKWYKGMSVLASPAFAKHTTHFTEAVTFLFHANLHPTVYPWWAEAERVVHVKVTNKDFPWSKAFMRAVMTGLPDPDAVDLIWANEMRDKLTCFERAGLMAQQTHEYGYHADPWEAQVFREATFKLYNVPEPPVLKPNQKLRTTVMGRKGRKKMSNVKDVIRVIRQTELAKFDYLSQTSSQPVYFEKDTTFKDQITIMRFTDVLVGLHGSGLNNAMFMEPGSVVIAIMPANYIEYEWHNCLTGSGMTYLIQPNTDNKKYSTNCRPYPKQCDSLRPFQAKTKKCVPMWYCDAKVDVGATEVLYRQANYLIRNMKREMTKLHHNMPFGGGRNPSGKVTQLDD